jgi:hypothetical protein
MSDLQPSRKTVNLIIQDESGNLLPQVQVVVHTTNPDTKITNQDGSVRIQIAPQGETRITATKHGYETTHFDLNSASIRDSVFRQIRKSNDLEERKTPANSRSQEIPKKTFFKRNKDLISFLGVLFTFLALVVGIVNLPKIACWLHLGFCDPAPSKPNQSPQSSQPKDTQPTQNFSPNVPTQIQSSSDLPSPGTTIISSQPKDGIDYKLKGCRQESETIKCEFLVIDNEQNRKLYVYVGAQDLLTRIIDFNGFQARASDVEFGNSSSTNYVYQSLVKGSNLMLIVTFQKVPNNLDKLDVLEVVFWEKKQGYYSRTFRDVPVLN